MDMCATNRHFMINNASISLLVLWCICISLYSYGNGMLLGHIDSIREGGGINRGNAISMPELLLNETPSQQSTIFSIHS